MRGSAGRGVVGVSDDRAERLRSTRKRSKPSEQDEPSERGEPSEPSDQSDTSEPSGASEAGERSVKDEQVGRYMYLPEGQNERVDDVFRRLQFHYAEEYGRELEKNRHYFPLVVRYGLDELDGWDASDVRDALDGMGLLG